MYAFSRSLELDEPAPASTVAPGRTTLTQRLAPARVPSPPPAAVVQRTAEAGPAVDPCWFCEPVQRQASGADAVDDAAVHEAARAGTRGTSGSLPFREQIQRAFGRHDISGIAAHTDGEAARGAEAMGAAAFAVGTHVVFAGAPSLHTAAHEAAHVVQQRGGVHLAGGVGHEGDPHERHADAVADLVVRGESAEALLDRYTGRDPTAAGPAATVQRLAFATNALTSNPTAKAAFDLVKASLTGNAAAMWGWFDDQHDDHLIVGLTAQGVDSRYGGTEVQFFVGEDRQQKGIDDVSAQELEQASSIRIIVNLNADKIGQVNGNGKVVGVNQLAATLIHELTAHAERYGGFIADVRRKQLSGQQFVQVRDNPRGMMSDRVHHWEILEKRNASYNAVAARAEHLIAQQQGQHGWNLDDFRLDLLQDRYIQAGSLYLNDKARAAWNTLDRLDSELDQHEQDRTVSLQTIDQTTTDAFVAIRRAREAINGIVKRYPEFLNEPTIRAHICDVRFAEIDDLYEALQSALERRRKLR